MDPIERTVRRVVAELGDRLGVDHEVVDCEPDLADTARFVEGYGYALEDSANTIVVAGKGDPMVHVACVVLASTRLDVNRAVRKRLGVKKCSFAGADQTEALTGMTVGGVTPFALPETLPIWVDSRVMDREQIVLGGGSRACKVICAPSLLAGLPGLSIVDDLALVPDPG